MGTGADDHGKIAFLFLAADNVVDALDEGAGGVHYLHAHIAKPLVHRFGYAVGADDHGAAGDRILGRLDHTNTHILKVLHCVPIVDNRAQRTDLSALCRQLRQDVLEMIHAAGSGHPGGSLSAVEILTALYFEVMKVDPANPSDPDRDRFILSKGHAGPAVYATLALKGYFPKEQLLTLNQGGTNLPSHCDKNKTPGVDMTTGSLGQGTSLACGMALADKLQGHDSRTFLIVGDGETNEGQVWEAFTFAAAHKLSNLVVMIDWNKRQLDGFCEDIYPAANFHEKMVAFGFNTVTINGNDIEAVAQALEATRAGGEKPWAIVLDTVKGAGIEDVVNTAANHSMSVGDAAYEKWTAELRQLVAELEG